MTDRKKPMITTDHHFESRKSDAGCKEAAQKGAKDIDYASENMPVLSVIRSKFDYEKPFSGLKIAVCGHITKETAVTCLTLKSGGADLMVLPSEPATLQDHIVAGLKQQGIMTCGYSGMTLREWTGYKEQVFQFRPDIIMDEGAELLSMMYEQFPDYAENMIGSTVLTSSGISRCRNMERSGMLKHPVITLNSSKIKSLFDNYAGVGQTSVYCVAQICHLLFATETVVVVGYGSVGRGIARKSKALGARVIVCETNPINALSAYLEGYEVMSIQDAARTGTVFFTATGSVNVIPIDVIRNMKPGAILSNCGSGQKEIDIASVKEEAVSSEEIRPHLVRYSFNNGKYVHVLTDGLVTNLIGGNGNPPVIMDLTFSAAVLAVEYLVHEKLESRVHVLPESIDMMIASIKLNEYELKLSKPTEKQKAYDKDWRK